MNRLEVWLHHIATLLVAGTGVVYGWMRYVLEPVDPFAVVNHPLQPDLQHLHLLVAPLSIFALGYIVARHVLSQLLRGIQEGRRTGMSMILTSAPMILSGYLIQTAVAEEWRTLWIVTHCISAALWLAAYLIHVLRLVGRRQVSAVPSMG